MKKQTVTIKDIAKKLGISPSTVSRALKDHFEISQDTKDAVKRVAEELNYQPNSLALSLRYSKTFTIGVVIPEIVHYFFSTVISGIEDIAQRRGYNVILTQSNESLVREISNIQTLFNNRVDGLLISISRETEDYQHLELLALKGLPLVFFDRAPTDLPGSRVIIDDQQGGYLATKHLIDQGYQRIGFLSGGDHLGISEDRQKGYLQALEEAGMEMNRALIGDNAYDDDAARQLTHDLIKNEQIDAVFTANDLAAIGALAAATAYGKSVPQNFGIVGFSNWQFTALTKPSLSTVEQHGFQIGQKAAELLIEQIEAEEEMPPKTITLKTSLVERESSKRQ